MNRYYEEIMELPEKGTLGEVLVKWEQLHKRMQEGHVRTRHLLPELFLTGAPGIGRSHLLSLMAGFLGEAKLIEFSGERRYFEFRPEYCPPQGEFEELNRFANKLSEMAGFRSEFKGIICIELDEWTEHFREKYFNVFIEYLEEHCDNWLLIFTVNRADENVEELFSYLSMYFRLDRAELSAPSAKDYISHLEEFMISHSFTISLKAKNTLEESIEELMKSPLFDGYKSINRLGLDIVYEKYTAESFEGRYITGNDVLMFSADGEYIQTMLTNYEKKQQIGFM